MTQTKSQEIVEELRGVVLGRSSLIDIVLPPVVFALLNTWAGPKWAISVSLVMALGLALIRWRRGQRVLHALGGMAGVAVAAGFAILSGEARDFFYPNILGGILSVIIALVSVLFRRPMVAWTSYLARRWPLAWYWHPRVRPAYGEVTLFWALFFALRVGLQYAVYRQANIATIAATGVLLGWPTTLVLLVASYLYGTWRLGNLGGPSVQEFREESGPPWTSQRRGF